MTPLAKELSKPREIVVGTYRCTFGAYGKETWSAFGGTNAWDEEIKRHRFGGVEFEVVLREKGSA